MSGPKVSVYSLTPEQLAAIEAELKRRQEEALEQLRLLKESEKKTKEIQQYKDQCEHVEEFLKQYGEWIESSGVSSKIKECRAELDSCFNENNTCTSYRSNDELKRILDNVNLKLKKIKQLAQKIQEELTVLKSRLEHTLDSEISSMFEKKEVSLENKATEYSQFVKKSITVLFELRDNEFLPQIYRNEISQAIDRLDIAKGNGNLESFCQIELESILKKSNEFVSLWGKYGQEYQLLCMKYEMLCKQNGDKQIEMIPFTEKAVGQLKQLITAKEKQIKEMAEQEYICSALNEVMQDMGYDVIGHREVTKRNGKHFENDLYQYGNDTAINVTYADNGQISMELGKLDTNDRVPTGDECCYLENAMMQFCDNFREIEQRLLAKGVVVGTRIALAPPSVDYAQIINVDDYELMNKKSEEAKRVTKEHEKPLHMEN